MQLWRRLCPARARLCGGCCWVPDAGRGPGAELAREAVMAEMSISFLFRVPFPAR